MKVNYYYHGEVQNPELSVKQQKEILNLVTDLISNSNDILETTCIYESRIEEIKENETSIEINL